jgi:membrane fusion protein, multidrug efflux system
MPFKSGCWASFLSVGFCGAYAPRKPFVVKLTQFDFTISSAENGRSMTQGIPFVSGVNCGRLLALTLVPFLLCAGCKKRPAAGGPAPTMATSVIAAEAKRQPIAETLALVGTLAANEFIEVKSEIDGTIAEILFEEGQPVKKDDLLIRMDESKLNASLAEAEANLKLSTATFERAQELARGKLIPQQEYDQAASIFQANKATAELRRRQLKEARIYAPFAGVAGSRSVSPGQVISKNTVLTWLVDLSIVKAEFNVPERFLSGVKSGQRVQLTVAAYPRQKFEGEVYFLAPQVDPNTRTLLMKARIPNAEHELKPGMFANLDLTLTLRQDATVIPESALLSQGNRTSVFVIDSNSNAQVRPVKVGLRIPNHIEILSGLEPGERVVAEGLQKVRPGGPVRPAPGESSSPATNVVKRS